MNGPLIALDFDGVIHSYTSGWKGVSVIPDAPVPGAIEAILDYINSGVVVAIFSSRSKSLFGRWAMKRYLTHHMKEHFWTSKRPTAEWTALDVEAEYWGDAHSIVSSRIKWPWFKPAAFVTLDDRAITFDGTWPPIADLLAFKPWNKRRHPASICLCPMLGERPNTWADGNALRCNSCDRIVQATA